MLYRANHHARSLRKGPEWHGVLCLVTELSAWQLRDIVGQCILVGITVLRSWYGECLRIRLGGNMLSCPEVAGGEQCIDG